MDEARGAWFPEAKFGLMIHWGLYALLGGEWRGERMAEIGEWAQARFRIPNAEYRRLAGAFNPIYFDADEYVRLAQDAGMRYVVITAKHHDGFCLFRTRVNDYNIADATPFGRDVVYELANACAKRNMRMGLYYSQDLDWSEPNGGGYTSGHTWCGYGPWTNEWDFPDNARKNYAQCFEDKIVPQVTELLTGYGDLALIWFDTPQTLSRAQSETLVELVRRHQPRCLVNSRIGNGMGDYRSLGDNEIPASRAEAGLCESACTLNDTWGYKSFDDNWKDADTVYANLTHLNELGVNYLLNVGPDALGRIPAPAASILRRVGEKLGR